MTRENAFGQPIGDPVAWSAPPPPTPIVLHGRFARLEPLTTAHAAAVMAVLAPHPDLWTYQGEETPASIEAAAAAITVAQTQPDLIPYAIVHPETGAFRGRVWYLRIQPPVGSIEVGGIIYSPELQRTRAATEVQYLLMRHAFELGFRRYEWKCDSLNAPSRAAATRLGFVEEGTWRNALVTKGRNRDTTWFSITDAEWPGVRAGLESWLQDANFDAAGRQIRPLADFRNG